LIKPSGGTKKIKKRDGEKINLKNILLSKLNRKITILFYLVGLICPTLAIIFFYTVIINSFSESLSPEISNLLAQITITMIVLMAVITGLIGFIISKNISNPIQKLYNATRKIEKGEFDIKLDIKTGDELEELAAAFNSTAATLARLEVERKEMDAAKTEFLSITSHELRSPMTPMKAQLQMMEEGYFGKINKKQKESIRIITRNADRLDNIIADFLEISRIEAARLKFNFRETDLVETIKETAEFMQCFANEKKIKIVVNSDGIPKIQADPDRISQVLRNLINNAIKFSPEQSKIEVDARLEKNHVMFSVKDCGIGLTPENQIRIFEPFYQVENVNRRKHGGTGLGLAICRGIVESQKGKIWVESKEDFGSKFYFTFPLEPVRKIEPIKVLFSERGIVNRKIKKEFQLELGPLGESEFEELKSKNSINKDDLFQYIDFLVREYILPAESGDSFKNRVSKIFGDEKEKGIINDKTDNVYKQ
jgi:signal transduction histidine kinase